MGQKQSVTAHDKQVVKTVWDNLVRKDIPAFGVVLYEIMAKVPNVNAVFNYEEDLFDDELEKHCRLVFVDLNAWIDAMDDHESITHLFQENANVHAPRCFVVDAYNLLRVCVIKTVRTKDTDRTIQEPDYKIFDKVLRYAFEMIQEYSDLERKKLVHLSK